MITIHLDKDVSEQVLSVTAKYLLEIRDVMHGDNLQIELPLAKAETAVAAPAIVPNDPVDEPEAPEVMDTELDAAGFPWDNRIHAGTKTKTVDGCWKRKRGISEELVGQVQAEFKNGGVTEAIATVEEAPVPAVPAAPTTVASEGAAGVAVPAAPVAAPPPEEMPTPPAAAGRSFTELSALITDRVTADPTIGQKIQEAIIQEGFGSVPELTEQSAEDIGRVYAAIEAL